MKLKAPQGVGDTCVAAVAIASRARRYESGVYSDEVLQHCLPPSMVVISNIAAE